MKTKTGRLSFSSPSIQLLGPGLTKRLFFFSFSFFFLSFFFFKAQAVVITKLRGKQCQAIGTVKCLTAKCF